MPGLGLLELGALDERGGQQQLVAVLVTGDQRLRLVVVDRGGGLVARRAGVLGERLEPLGARVVHPLQRLVDRGARRGSPSARPTARRRRPRTATRLGCCARLLGRAWPTAWPCRGARPRTAGVPSAWRSATPSGRADGLRRAGDAPLGDGEPLADALGRRARRGAAAGRRLQRDEPEAQLGGLLHRVDEVAVAVGPGTSTTMLLAALGRDLGLGDTGAVDPLVDDPAGLLEAGRVGLLAVVGACLEGDPRAALEVEAQLGLPLAAERHAAVQRGHDQSEHNESAPGTGRLTRHCYSLLVDRGGPRRCVAGRWCLRATLVGRVCRSRRRCRVGSSSSCSPGRRPSAGVEHLHDRLAGHLDGGARARARARASRRPTETTVP